MRRLTSKDLKELNLLKHYRIIRKWACKISDLNDADLGQQTLEQIIETRVDSCVEREKSHYPKISYI